MDENRKWVEKEDDIKGTTLEYFKRLLSSSGPDRDMIKEVSNAITTKISNDQKKRLDSPFAKEDIE